MTQMTDHREDATVGRTFADFLDGVLTDPRRFVSLLVLGGVLVGGSILVARALGFKVRDVSVTTLGTTFAIMTEQGETKEYLFVVHPQGWQPTGIFLDKGRRVQFKGAGKVCIDLHGLSHLAERMHDLERKYGKGLDKLGAAKAPEDFFTDEDRESLAGVDGLWVGPGGDRSAGAVARNFADQDFPARTAHKILPTAPYGMLVGAVVTDDSRGPDQSSQVFEIGNGIGNQSPQAGYLWLGVNDVRHDRSPRDLFSFDNLGYFLVTVTVSR
jgi:hypothetical protein